MRTVWVHIPAEEILYTSPAIVIREDGIILQFGGLSITSPADLADRLAVYQMDAEQITATSMRPDLAPLLARGRALRDAVYRTPSRDLVDYPALLTLLNGMPSRARARLTLDFGIEVGSIAEIRPALSRKPLKVSEVLAQLGALEAANQRPNPHRERGCGVPGCTALRCDGYPHQ